MALIARLPAFDAAAAAARALEQLLGHDVMLGVEPAIVIAPTPELFPPGATRSVALPFGNGIVGEVTLVASEHFATSMEAATSDASLLTAALPSLVAAADAIEPVIHLQAVPDYAGEISTDTLLTSVTGDFVIVPIMEGDQRVACVVVRIVDDEPAVAPVAPVAPAFTQPAAAFTAPPVAPVAPAAPVAAIPAPSEGPAPVYAANTVATYDFQPLNDGTLGAGAPRPLALLNDVKLQLIAELGRRQMKVRDIVSLEPGSVIELDRAAGSPVDVLVNGVVLAHGEVVVIDEEFGIRVSEIIVGDS
jgi:flagellar motor switch protein FliN